MDYPQDRDTSPEPGVGPRAARLSVVRGRFNGSWSLVEPLILIVIGIALGLVDQTSSEVAGMFRIPALLAALLLVGQGLSLLEASRSMPAERVIEVREPLPVGAEDPTTLAANAPTGRQVVVAGTEDEAEEASRPNNTRAYLVIGLSIWLGVATLVSPTAPLQLILLSLLSAFLLFARGWMTLAPPSPSE